MAGISPYGLFPQEGDGELVVRDLQTVRGLVRTAATARNRIAFTHNAGFVVFSTFSKQADVDTARKAKKDAPKSDIGVLELQADGPAWGATAIKNFHIPENGASVAAHLAELGKRPIRPHFAFRSRH